MPEPKYGETRSRDPELKCGETGAWSPETKRYKTGDKGLVPERGEKKTGAQTLRPGTEGLG